MDFFIDFLMEIFFEFFVEGYIALMLHCLPKEKITQKTYNIIKNMVTIVSILCLVAILFGFIAMFSENDSIKNIGAYAFTIALVITVVQIILGIVGRIKK